MWSAAGSNHRAAPRLHLHNYDTRDKQGGSCLVDDRQRVFLQELEQRRWSRAYQKKKEEEVGDGPASAAKAVVHFPPMTCNFLTQAAADRWVQDWTFQLLHCKGSVEAQIKKNVFFRAAKQTFSTFAAHLSQFIQRNGPRRKQPSGFEFNQPIKEVIFTSNCKKKL